MKDITVSEVVQRSDEWEALRKSRLGASEIFALSTYISNDEFMQVGLSKEDIDGIRNEPSYISPFNLYHKIKNPSLYTHPLFALDLSKFGQKIEEVAKVLLSETNLIEDGKVYYNDNLIASLDIEAIENSDKTILTDHFGKPISLIENKNHLIEVKGRSSRLKKSPDWKFIFQMQLGFLMSNLQWGKLVYISLVNDNDFERGYICGLPLKEAVDYIQENATVHTYIIARNNDLIDLIKLSIHRFLYSVQFGIEPKIEDNIDSINYKLLYNIIEQKSAITNPDNTLIIKDERLDNLCKISQSIKSLEAEKAQLMNEVKALMYRSGCLKIKSDESIFKMQKNYIKIVDNQGQE